MIFIIQLIQLLLLMGQLIVTYKAFRFCLKHYKEANKFEIVFVIVAMALILYIDVYSCKTFF